MNDGNMIQEPPACPVCGLAVEERDPRRGKPLSIHRACRNRRREELRKERERGVCVQLVVAGLVTMIFRV